MGQVDRVSASAVEIMKYVKLLTCSVTFKRLGGDYVLVAHVLA